MKKKKKLKPAYSAVRKAWTRKPATKVVPNTKAEKSKKACRDKEDPGAGMRAGASARIRAPRSVCAA